MTRPLSPEPVPPEPVSPEYVSPESLLLARRAERRFLIACLVLLAVMVAWAALATLDVVSNAQGEVVPASRLKAVQHLEGGIVKEIMVEEGSVVRRGQPLIRLDPLRANSDSEELDKRLIGLRIDVMRMTSETDGRQEPVFTAELERDATDMIAQARNIFETRRKRFSHDVRTQENLVIQRESDQHELSQRIVNNRKTLEIVSSQVEISASLLRKDLTSRMAHLEYLRQQQSLRTLIATDQNGLVRAEAALREARERLGSVREAFVEQARKELAAAQQQVDELSQRAVKFGNTQERTVLRAPVDGIVKTLSVATEGGVIQAGQTVAEIVPVEDRLIIEAQLAIQDIGYVHVGQPARVTLASSDGSLFGHIDGTVVRVSPDALVSANAGAAAKTFYKVRIETEQSRFKAGTSVYQLYPGMQVNCSILIGTRTIFEYLLSPWFRTLRFAFQER
ncbi:MAG: HlyD family type I secretion periplasmic adaptor subunit [Rhodospirillaceae bacterium]